MLRSYRGGLSVALLSLALAVPDASGAGFSIFEQGAKGMGFAGAFTAQANDPSAIFHNPAGIAWLKGTQVYFGGTVVRPHSDFAGAVPFPGPSVTEKSDAGVVVPPTFYLTRSMGGKTAVGVGVMTPFGLKTKWASPNTYSGRFLSQEAELKGIAINPTVATQLSDRVSIGAGLDVRFSKVKLRRRVPTFNPFTLRAVDAAQVELNSDWDTALGFNAGLLFKAADNVSFGASYRHKVKSSYKGQGTFGLLDTGSAPLNAAVATVLPSGDIPVETGIETPGIATFGIAVKQDDWTVESDVVWYQWSTFNRLPITFPTRATLSSVVEEDYQNSWQYRIGVERHFSDKFSGRAGYFFDFTPAPAASVSPLLPDASRHGFCLGASWLVGRVRVDAGSWYLKFVERSTEGLQRDQYNGTYNSNALTFGLSFGYTF
jgi:long-chain fatty acid transport protein